MSIKSDLENEAQAAAMNLCEEFALTLMMLSPHALTTIGYMRGYKAGFDKAVELSARKFDATAWMPQPALLKTQAE